MKLFAKLISALLLSIGSKEALSQTNNETFVDPRDSKIYKISRIGNQIWMAENLAWLPSLDYYGSDRFSKSYKIYSTESDVESNSEDLTIVKQSDSYTKYGVLYNYHAANTACPSGWHLPSDKEWQELETFLGMDPDEINKINIWRESGSVGRQLKSTIDWQDSDNIEPKNNIDFNALPAGYYFGVNEKFTARGDEAYFWGSSKNEPMHCSVYRNISKNLSGIYRSCEKWDSALSVRCIKN